jgi:hypothetical protein
MESKRINDMCTLVQDLKLSKLLLVDALNYCNAFFNIPISKKATIPYSTLESCFSSVASFVNAARDEGFQVEVFIDDNISSYETESKWLKRREKEGK